MNKQKQVFEVELTVPVDGIAGFKIAQKKDQDGKLLSETVIGYDASKQQHQIICPNFRSPSMKTLTNPDSGQTILYFVLISNLPKSSRFSFAQ